MFVRTHSLRGQAQNQQHQNHQQFQSNMKLHRDTPAGINIVTSYGADYVAINKQEYTSSLILLPDRIIEGWAENWKGHGLEALSDADLQALCDLAPELVLLGTGSQQRFPAPRVMRPLIDARIGYEVMSLQAACRTYNILVAEGRQVAAALLID